MVEVTEVTQAIVKGQTVSTGDFSGAAAIYRNGSFSCSGTLVHPEWVVTAAHCNPAVGATTVGLGEARGDHVRLPISDTFSHPEWNGTRQDVAVIKLSEPATETPTPIVVADFDATGQMATAWGFGRTGVNAQGSEQLLAVERRMPSFDECIGRLGQQARFDATMLCQFAAAFDASTCRGDSGGPLTVEVSGRRHLVGVVQGGDNGRCGESPDGSVNFYTALANPTNYSFLRQHLPAEAFASDAAPGTPVPAPPNKEDAGVSSPVVEPAPSGELDAASPVGSDVGAPVPVDAGTMEPLEASSPLGQGATPKGMDAGVNANPQLPPVVGTSDAQAPTQQAPAPAPDATNHVPAESVPQAPPPLALPEPEEPAAPRIVSQPPGAMGSGCALGSPVGSGHSQTASLLLLMGAALAGRFRRGRRQMRQAASAVKSCSS